MELFKESKLIDYLREGDEPERSYPPYNQLGDFLYFVDDLPGCEELSDLLDDELIYILTIESQNDATLRENIIYYFRYYEHNNDAKRDFMLDIISWHTYMSHEPNSMSVQLAAQNTMSMISFRKEDATSTQAEESKEDK
jgi:hypothetical protein